MTQEERFAQVWRRVAPEGGPIVPKEPAPAPAAEPAFPEEPWLQGFLRREREQWAWYHRMLRLPALARSAHASARRLRAAYFLLTGVDFWPPVGNPRPLPLPIALREQFLREGKLEEDYKARAHTPFAGLYMDLSAAAHKRAQSIQTELQRRL